MRLSAYLIKHKETPYAFAQRSGVPHPTLHRVLNSPILPGLENAAKIVAASGGKVAFEDLLPPRVKRQRKGAA
jgi:hypothetical protein